MSESNSLRSESTPLRSSWQETFLACGDYNRHFPGTPEPSDPAEWWKLPNDPSLGLPRGRGLQ
jgi:hypothetical protein